MTLLLAVLTGLAVGWHERRHPGPASDPNAIGLLTAIMTALTAVGEAIGSAATTVGGALGIGGETAVTAAGTAAPTAAGTVAGAMPTAAGTAAAPIGETAASGLGMPASFESAMAGGTDMGPAFEAAMSGQMPASAVGSGTVGSGTVGGTMPSSLMDKIQKYQKLFQGHGGGDKGGGGQTQATPAPQLSHGAATPFAPVATPPSSLAGLMQAIQQKRARLAAMGLGQGGS